VDGEELRTIRRRLGPRMTQAEMAKKLGCKRVTCTRYETNRRKIPKGVALLAAALDREQKHLRTAERLRETVKLLRVELSELREQFEKLKENKGQ
jgi:transcriptional regulator with XRE-family HTH domain